LAVVAILQLTQLVLAAPALGREAEVARSLCSAVLPESDQMRAS